MKLNSKNPRRVKSVGIFVVEVGAWKPGGIVGQSAGG